MSHGNNILLIFGGGGNEHDVSVISKNFYKANLKQKNKYNIFEVEIKKDRTWELKEPNRAIYLNSNKQLCDQLTHQPLVDRIDYIFPCIHGAPGETGHIQGLFEMFGIPYFGNGVEVSALCMNKISTKLWLQHLNIPIVEFMVLTNAHDLQEQQLAKLFFQQYKSIA